MMTFQATILINSKSALIKLKELSLSNFKDVWRKKSRKRNKFILIFTDTSSEAYGAVACQRYAYKSGEVASCLLMSKARVTPLKSISIPRLELLGAVLCLWLEKKVTRALQMEIKDVTFWCDIMNVLCSIRNQSHTLKPFVANRVGLIQSLTDPRQWIYILPKINHVDLLMRGSAVNDLAISTYWWNGL